jgi:ribosomal protein S12 methylthiotransferase accessory factor
VSDESHHIAGGTSHESERQALIPALAEALERYLWFTYDFQGDDLVSAPHTEAAQIAPERFAGFDDAQRAKNARLTLRPDAKYRWVAAHSWVQDASVLVPAQIIASRPFKERPHDEPIIRIPITTGLATWPTREGAILRGALEIIERDAFMIMWLNQLSLPRMDIRALRSQSASLSSLIASCERHRLAVHLVRMITDAPAHAVCAILEDTVADSPRFNVGIKASASLPKACEAAIEEALRARHATRLRQANDATKVPADADPKTINHYERVLFYAHPEHSHRLAFMTRGPLVEPAHTPWEEDETDAHLARVIEWARAKNYEMCSYAFTKAQNVSPWHIEMVVIPELQPIHQDERYPAIGGVRLSEIPKAFGYEPRVPFIEAPQPFA